MKRLFLPILILVTLLPVQGSNVTQRAVHLQERTILVTFINMGVDASWGSTILEYVCEGLPVLEEEIGVPLPPEIETVEVYGREYLQVLELAVGYNDGNVITLKGDFYSPHVVLHELVHFWTIKYHIPWPLAEGYSDLYSSICAFELGYTDVFSFELPPSRPVTPQDWVREYENLKNVVGAFPLNAFDYRVPGVSEQNIAYFYYASSVIMHNFYYTAGAEDLRKVNRRVAEVSASLDDSVGGIGIIQYVKAAKETTGCNYAGLFMPVFYSTWDPTTVKAFEDAVARYCGVSALTQTPDTDEQMKSALTALVRGDFATFQTGQQNVIVNYYAKLKEAEEKPELSVTPPPPEKGILQNPLLIIGIIVLTVIVISLVLIFSRLAKEEEEMVYDLGAPLWEQGARAPPGGGSKKDERLPEPPDLQELTK